MESKQERLSITKDWLPRYTGMEIDEFGEYILLTNFSDYVLRFAEMFDCDIKGEHRPMQAATNSAGLSIVNFGIGSPNAAIIISIALGIALSKPEREVVCIDGDGSMLMHLGSLTSIASLKPNNFRHILMNNEVHESVGGQDTAAKNIDLSAIVGVMGPSKMFKAETPAELKANITDFMKCVGPSFLEVKIRPGSREDLGRPTIKPVNNKENFMGFLEK